MMNYIYNPKYIKKMMKIMNQLMIIKLTVLEAKSLFFGNIADSIGYLISAKNISKKAAAELVKKHYQVKKVYF